MRRSRNRKHKKASTPVKESKSALDALKELKKLQSVVQRTYGQTATVAGSGKSERSVGSNDLAQDEITGGGLQWFEKLHDEKLNTVEARLGAQTTGMVLGVKSELEGKISQIRESNTKHVIGIIVTIFLAFISLYFAALISVEEKVESRVTIKIDALSSRVVELDEKTQEQFKSLIKQIHATPKSGTTDM